MNSLLNAVILIACALPLAVSAANPADTEALALIERMVPSEVGKFLVETSLPQQGGKDTFSLSDTADGKILIKGNNGVSVASGFNWYLKNRANCHISWCGDQLALPNPLPKVGEPVTIVCPMERRVYFNYCTLSYTAAWWDWARWQREIDFMAMQGVNTPLATVGLEAVWYHTLLKNGFTDLEARSFLVGPAFSAWQWMTNIESHCGPLPKSWIDQSVVLGKKIIDRQIALGMTPIQQGFTGYMPRLAKEKFPTAKIEFKHNWVGFPGAAQLDPLDPLFAKFGKSFLAEQQALFGGSHLYGCDPFHEGSPPVTGDEYLIKVGQAIDKLISEHDPKGTIVMQSWSIRKPLATAITKDRLFIVDLGGLRHDKHENFWGYKFSTGRLHNFGGRIKLHGDITLLATNPFADLQKKLPNCVGAGLFMEGTTHNPVFFDLAFDQFWNPQPVDPNDWLHAYARRRYGAESANASKAWDILLQTAYKPGTDTKESSSMIAARPALKTPKSGPNGGLNIPYDPNQLLAAWTLLLADADELKGSDAYRFDIVDLGRQVLSDYAQRVQPAVIAAWEAKDLKAFDHARANFIQLLLDVDTLIHPRPEYSFAKWVTDARSRGTTVEEKNLYEKNARCLLTLWGPIADGEPLIQDYAWREWSGLIKDYYVPRWEMYFSMLRQHLVDKTDYDENFTKKQMPYSRAGFRVSPFFNKLADWELNWVNTPSVVASPATAGDEVTLTKQFHDKYLTIIRKEATLQEELATNPGNAVGEWRPGSFDNKEYKTVDFDITSAIQGEGTYAVTMLFIKSKSRLNITKVELIEGNQTISADAHQGYAGAVMKDNTYQLKLDEHAFGTKYALRVTAKTDGSTDSSGKIYLKKK